MNHPWLRAGRWAVLAIVMACAPAAAQQTPAPAAAHPAADSVDVATPEAVVTALYDVISGPASAQRDWDRFRSLFLPGARLAFVHTAPNGRERLFGFSVDEFIQAAGPSYQQSAGFWERGIGHRTERFGNVAHVFTAYESRLAGPDAAVEVRGINSVQLIRNGGRWWITNLVWDEERAGNAIPAEILQSQ
jgi:hypothetical protein